VEEVRTVNPRGKLLDLTSREAFHLGICDTVVNSREEVIKLCGIEAAKVMTMRMTWAEGFVRFITSPVVVFVLILAGLIALVFSLKVPGLGLPEILTAACFILVFFGHYMAGLATEIEIAMFVLGVALLVLEIFVIPGFGVTGIAGITLVLASLLLAMQGFEWPKQPWQIDRFTTNLTILLGSFASAIVVLMVMVKFLPSVPVLNKLVLKTKLEEKDGVTVAPPDLTDCLGRSGVATTTLRPAGKIMLDGKTVDAVTEGDYIEKGQAVSVVQADGTRIVVRKA
jgi:membrane-bound serine protease (ClpP class)